MAITPVNARYEGFIFDGENSRTYGVYITDVEVFGAPVRNVEMVTIPGRNGAFALDKGSYENIEVTYHCAMGCDSQADFNAGISAFRNMLASRTGYKRLEDEINTSEYRMACFRGGISVPTLNKETATFDVVFDCKPQRYLKSGETAVSMTSGDTITNPTLYDASPILIVDGNGTIDLNGTDIAVRRVPYGYRIVKVAGEDPYSTSSTTTTVELNKIYANGDPITIEQNSTVSRPYAVGVDISLPASATREYSISASSRDSVSGIVTGGGMYQEHQVVGYPLVLLVVAKNQLDFIAGTASTLTGQAVYTIKYSDNGGALSTSTVTADMSVAYDGDKTITITTTIASSPNLGAGETYARYYSNISVVSSVYAGDVLYLDLDIGEAYTYDGDTLISLNDSVYMPAKLPVLAPGANTITYDNTITQFQVVPRWWQL